MFFAWSKTSTWPTAKRRIPSATRSTPSANSCTPAEIVLNVTPGDGATLVKAIYWWNNINNAGNYWWAQYTSKIAVLFLDDIPYGRYKIYYHLGSATWIFKTTIYALGGYSHATYYTSGGPGMLGYKGVAQVKSKADIIMYFFN